MCCVEGVYPTLVVPCVPVLNIEIHRLGAVFSDCKVLNYKRHMLGIGVGLLFVAYRDPSTPLDP